MILTRRGFAGRAALGLGLSLLPGAVLAQAVGTGGKLDYIDLAKRSARWIDASAQQDVTGAVRWPADPLKPDSISPGLYAGSAGIVAFFTALGRYSNEPVWLDKARKGARGLIADAAVPDSDLDSGLYTGRAGLVHVLADLHKATGEVKWLGAAKQIAHDIVRGAQDAPGGVEWSDSPDIVSGGSGVGLVLLRYGREWNDPVLIEAAEKTGRRLIALGEPAPVGVLWRASRESGLNFPNFSHGTAGVAYYLAELHQATGKPEYLKAALDGAAYLGSIAARKDGGALIFHREDGGLDRFYVGWCHGPAGTARLFYKLHQITRDPSHAAWVDALTTGLKHTGAPLQPSAGYWNNVSQCCGNAGIAQHYIDLTRYWRTEATTGAIEPIIGDTLRRATREGGRLSWTQAEHRTQPENLVAQTGLMQGASGLGLLFLQLHALEQDKPWEFPLPDTPFRTLI